MNELIQQTQQQGIFIPQESADRIANLMQELLQLYREDSSEG